MILVRKTTFEERPETYKVGDQFVFDTNSFGVVSATCHKVDDNVALFICDDCVAKACMCINKNNSNAGCFDNSDLKLWLKTKFQPELPPYIRNHLVELSIPTYGMIFGHDGWYNTFEPDSDEQLPLMKSRKYRIADFKDESEWYWLQNATKQSVSATSFAIVIGLGDSTYRSAGHVHGVRPFFVIRR